MSSVFATWYHSGSLLIYNQFGDIAIATGAPLVAIPEQIRCKRGHVPSANMHSPDALL